MKILIDTEAKKITIEGDFIISEFNNIIKRSKIREYDLHLTSLKINVDANLIVNSLTANAMDDDSAALTFSVIDPIQEVNGKYCLGGTKQSRRIKS